MIGVRDMGAVVLDGPNGGRQAAATRTARLVILVAGVLVASPAHAARGEISARVLAQRLSAKSVSLTQETIVGDVRLSGQIGNALSCRDCRFLGDFDASRATFAKSVDLGGSEIVGKLDLT